MNQEPFMHESHGSTQYVHATTLKELGADILLEHLFPIFSATDLVRLAVAVPDLKPFLCCCRDWKKEYLSYFQSDTTQTNTHDNTKNCESIVKTWNNSDWLVQFTKRLHADIVIWRIGDIQPQGELYIFNCFGNSVIRDITSLGDHLLVLADESLIEIHYSGVFSAKRVIANNVKKILPCTECLWVIDKCGNLFFYRIMGDEISSRKVAPSDCFPCRHDLEVMHVSGGLQFFLTYGEGYHFVTVLSNQTMAQFQLIFDAQLDDPPEDCSLLLYGTQIHTNFPVLDIQSVGSNYLCYDACFGPLFVRLMSNCLFQLADFGEIGRYITESAETCNIHKCHDGVALTLGRNLIHICGEKDVTNDWINFNYSISDVLSNKSNHFVLTQDDSLYMSCDGERFKPVSVPTVLDNMHPTKLMLLGTDYLVSIAMPC